MHEEGDCFREMIAGLKALWLEKGGGATKGKSRRGGGQRGGGEAGRQVSRPVRIGPPSALGLEGQGKDFSVWPIINTKAAEGF